MRLATLCLCVNKWKEEKNSTTTTKTVPPLYSAKVELSDVIISTLVVFVVFGYNCVWQHDVLCVDITAIHANINIHIHISTRWCAVNFTFVRPVYDTTTCYAWNCKPKRSHKPFWPFDIVMKKISTNRNTRPCYIIRIIDCNLQWEKYSMLFLVLKNKKMSDFSRNYIKILLDKIIWILCLYIVMLRWFQLVTIAMDTNVWTPLNEWKISFELLILNFSFHNISGSRKISENFLKKILI